MPEDEEVSTKVAMVYLIATNISHELNCKTSNTDFEVTSKCVSEDDTLSISNILVYTYI